MPAARVDRRLAAILAADIVGYSRLIEQDEAGTLAAIRDLRREVIDPLLAEHRGRIVKLMGDGAITEFGSVVDAVACAVAIQKNAAARQAEIPPERRIVFRMGVNLGDVVVEGDDLLGDGVNVAARLEQLCPPGGVLISGTAYDHMKGKFSLPFDYAGEQQVKNISQPVRTYSVRMEGVKLGWSLRARRFRRWLLMAAALLPVLIIAGASIWWFRPVDVPAGKPSVAVLPFASLGGDDATGRLADGITEDIITDLATFPEFDVVARNSTEVYKGKAVDVRQVSEDLGVGYVLEGSIQRQGEQVRITAQLIDGDSGNHLSSERWDRPTSDIFAVQTEIAEQVANRLGGGAGLIQTAGREAARRKRPNNLTAYELYLLGTEKLEQQTAAENEEAIELLNRAVEQDPGLARAWVELSHAHSLSRYFGTDSTAAQKAAMAAAERAVMLDTNDAEAHAALGMRLGNIGELARAEAAFETALRLSPSSAEIMTFYAGWASSFGEPERGAEIVDRVIRLNPNYPKWALGNFYYAYFMAGRYEDAAGLLERVPPDDHDNYSWVYHAGSYAALGRAEEAQALVKQALDRSPDLTIEGFVNDPGWSEAERQRLIETMRAAGFPPCAKAEELAGFPKPVRLPECEKT
ncbi:MAG TPA: adenylate/guanylate cyclase domain-containing protein [Geminicoccaceae bacterium]|nr:adenylate/guanylate cyclase domain-containing protein [Geminicoccaceae bacterium]